MSGRGRPAAGTGVPAANPTKGIIPGRIMPGTYRAGDEGFDFIVQVMGLRMVHRSYPNGSNFEELVPQEIRFATPIDGWLGGYRYNNGRWVEGPDGQEYVVRLHISRGSGTDLGIHFNNRSDLWSGLVIEVID